MSTTLGYTINLVQDHRGDDTEAFIRKVLEDEHIIKWAYILHDKECYNQHDLDSMKFDYQRIWAEGFPGKEKYSSVSEFISEKVKTGPRIGDKMQAYWRIVIITDSSVTIDKVMKDFKATGLAARPLQYKIDIADAITRMLGEDKYSVRGERHHYSDDEVKTNFDIREYLAEVSKTAKLEIWKKNFDPAMVMCLAGFAFIVVLALKFSSVSKGVNQWILPAVVGGIGILYIVANLLAMRASKKQNRFISGIPFIGGVHLLLAGLASPCKWLALLCLLDFTIWNFVSMLFASRNK